MASVSPSQEEKAKGIVPVLACVLHQLCTANDELAVDPKKAVSKFHALCIPALGIRGYLERISKYSGCSPECFVLALVYIDRIIQSRGFIVNSYSIHRLLITGVMLAAKFFDDHYYNNAYYAKVGGVACEEMNSLEVEFLFMLNFHLFVSTRTYKLYYQELYAHSKNAKSTCGCSSANVPILVLPFPTEDEKPLTKDSLKPQEDGSQTASMQTTSTTSSTSSSSDVSPSDPLSDPDQDVDDELDDEGDEMEDIVYTDDSKKEESVPSSLPPSKTLTASASQQQLAQAQKLQQQQQQQQQHQQQHQQHLQHLQHLQLLQQQQLLQQPKYPQVTGVDKPSFDQTSTRRAPGLPRSHSSGVGSTLTNHHRKAKSDLGQDFDRSTLLQSPKPKMTYPLPDPKLGLTQTSQTSDSIMTTDGFPGQQPDLGSRNFRRVQSGTDLSGLRTSRSDTGLIPVSSLPVGSAPRPTGPAKKFSFRSAVAVK